VVDGNGKDQVITINLSVEVLGTKENVNGRKLILL